MKIRSATCLTLATFVTLGSAAFAQSPPAAPALAPKPFAPPQERTLPDNDFAKVVRRGEDIFLHTGEAAKQFTGNSLSCSNCHLDAGRRADSAPMWAAYVSYPAYRSKNKHVNTLSERIQGCFSFSMNGKAPPLGDETLVALEAYAYWLATGAPTNTKMPGAGYPKLQPPAAKVDYARGEKVFAENCALCHGMDGQGQKSNGKTAFPPLWGPASYNWGAGMAQLGNAAGFIKANMPFSRGGTLSDQQAWDVATYMNSHERPQDPRFRGSVAQTRSVYHDSADSLYGTVVNGHLLGQSGAAIKHPQ
jgi:thiosulfate dehydrogenase